MPEVKKKKKPTGKTKSVAKETVPDPKLKSPPPSEDDEKRTPTPDTSDGEEGEEGQAQETSNAELLSEQAKDIADLRERLAKYEEESEYRKKAVASADFDAKWGRPTRDLPPFTFLATIAPAETGEEVLDPVLVWSIPHSKSDRTTIEKRSYKCVKVPELSKETLRLVNKDTKLTAKANEAHTSMLAMGGIFNALIEVAKTAEHLPRASKSILSTHAAINHTSALMMMEMSRLNLIIRNAGLTSADAPKVSLDDDSKLFADDIDSHVYQVKREADRLSDLIVVGTRGNARKPWKDQSKGKPRKRGYQGKHFDANYTQREKAPGQDKPEGAGRGGRGTRGRGRGRG
jgi:hypothetical protein